MALEQNISARPPETAAPEKKNESGQAGLEQVSLNDMTPGEMLITYDIMHNPAVEAVASHHARDAMAFANDAMINLGHIEQMQQKAQSLGSPYDWDDDDDDNLSPEEKAKRRDQKLANAITDAAQDAHEDRMEQQRKELSEQQQDFLRGQHIKTKDGKELSALDIVNSLDKMLNNWDDTFNEMVDQGIADPKDKNKIYKNMTKYRNMMADPNLSEAEKQKRREEMIQKGQLTQEQINFADKKAELEPLTRSAKLSQENVERAASTDSKTSVEMRADGFENDGAASKKPAQPPTFTMSAESGIKSPVNMTSSFNSTATAADEDPFSHENTPTKPAAALKNTATATHAPDAAFG